MSENVKSNDNVVKSQESKAKGKTRSTQANQSGKKKKIDKKEKKAIIPKYYAGTNVRKLPKVPKAALNDLSKNLEHLTMTEDQMQGYLTAIILGFVPDKFGLEAGIDVKLKAMSMLTALRKEKMDSVDSEESKKNDELIEALAKALGERKIEGVDD